VKPIGVKALKRTETGGGEENPKKTRVTRIGNGTKGIAGKQQKEPKWKKKHERAKEGKRPTTIVAKKGADLLR